MSTQQAVVVGGGVIGLAVARQLTLDRPGTQVTVLEKEPAVAQHQSGRNSGVVHAGLYYPPGSLKARLCRRGVGLLREYCADRGVHYEECGKVLVARNEVERSRLDGIRERAETNGVPGMTLVGPEGLRDIEPHVRGVAGLHSPSTAIVDYAGVCRALAADVVARQGRVVTGAPVSSIQHRGGRMVLRTGHPEHPEISADLVVVCAGLQSDLVARSGGGGADPRIVPFKGQYYLLRPAARSLVRGLIYPVPDPRYPFLGVHLTKRWDGEVLVGPNAVLAISRESYERGDAEWRELAELARHSGFRRFARRNWRTGAREIAQSTSRHLFVHMARRYVPELRTTDVIAGPAGIRAQAMDADGGLVDDFRIERLGPLVNLRNAPSPGATSSLAIAEHLVAMLP
jgi:(S)-2-hydroxyglutarate dehydrogenase